jgi:4-hydroxy-tetrahydrodipicolinate synthase
MFDEKGEIDEEAMRAHLDFLIESGVHGLVALGTAGMFISLSYEERKRIFRIFIDQAGGRVPVYCMTGFFDTQRTIALSQYVEEAGVDGIMVVLPYYQKPAKQSVLEHYRAVSRHTSLPIMLYNNYLESACERVSEWEIAELAQEGVISSVKTNTGETMVIHNLKTLIPSDIPFRIFHGSYLCAFDAIVAGADGIVSGLLNMVPAEARRLWDMIRLEEDYKGALTFWWEKLVPLIQLMHFNRKGGEPEFCPFAMEVLRMRGQASGYTRQPYTPLSEAFRERLRDLLTKLELVS